MNYAKINKYDVANGPGVRVSLFVSGCRLHCKGCFNQETWDFDYGKPFDSSTVEEILEALKPVYISGLTILGGDPLEPENASVVDLLCTIVRNEYPNKTIWLYTGRIFEIIKRNIELINAVNSDYIPKDKQDYFSSLEGIFKTIDIVVDGPFIESEKDITLKFKGSRNQKIIEVKSGKELLDF